MKSKSKSLSHFINGRITIIYLIVLVISIPLLYATTKFQIDKDQQVQLELTYDMINSFQRYLTDNHVPEGNFHQTTTLPPHAKTSSEDYLIADFLTEHPDYYIKSSSNSPVNSSNRSNDLELSLLGRFRDNPGMESIAESDEMGGQAINFIAKPILMQEGCDGCHVDRRIGSVMGVTLVGVKTDKISRDSLERTALVVGLLTILFAIIISSLNTTIRSHVINPIQRINNRTLAVSRGEIHKEFVSKRNDEIGELIGSIELLRRSLKVAMDRMRG